MKLLGQFLCDFGKNYILDIIIVYAFTRDRELTSIIPFDSNVPLLHKLTYALNDYWVAAYARKILRDEI